MGHVPSLCVLCSPCYSNFGHCTTTINVWERIGEKHLAQLVGEGACQPVISTMDIRLRKIHVSTKYRLGCELSYGICIHSYV